MDAITRSNLSWIPTNPLITDFILNAHNLEANANTKNHKALKHAKQKSSS
jgi:hypothetical protein